MNAVCPWHEYCSGYRVFRIHEEEAMRIDATNDSSAGQYARPSGARAATSFSAVMSAAMEKYSGQVDFTNMTRQELIDWMGDQLRSGKMTLDESHPFLFLTVREGAPEDTRYNFMQEVRGNIQFALSRNDEKKVRFWEAALRVMQNTMSEPE
jgi:hypothetical protein